MAAAPTTTALLLLFIFTAGPLTQALTQKGVDDKAVTASQRQDHVSEDVLILEASHVKDGATGRKLQNVNTHYDNVGDPQFADSLQRLLGNHKDNPTQVMVAPGQTRINQTQTALNGLSNDTINQVQQAISQLGDGFNTAIQIVIINEKTICDGEQEDRNGDEEKHD